MPKELILRVRVPTKEEILETVKKITEQLEGMVGEMAKVEVVEVKEAPKPAPTSPAPATHDITVTSTPQPETGTEQPPDTGTEEKPK